MESPELDNIIPFSARGGEEGGISDDGGSDMSALSNIDAEQALLGAILVKNQAYDAVASFLRPEHFTDPAHGEIFAAAAKLIERGHVASPITLKRQFDQEQALQPLGGGAYLADLAANVVTIAGAKDYGRLIHDLFLRRRVIEVAHAAIADARAASIDTPATAIVERLEAGLTTLNESADPDGDIVHAAEAARATVAEIEQAHRRGGALAGVTTGLRELDKLLGGLQPTDLIILAGRSSMGKTALAVNITQAASAAPPPRGGAVYFASLEMSENQIVQRLFAADVRISAMRQRDGRLSPADFEALMESQNRISALPLFIDRRSSLTLSQLRSRARRLKRRKGGLALIVVDYIQRMLPQSEAGQRVAGNRNDEVSAISRGLKALAMELGVPVLALSQLSRGPEHREDKRPQLHDLRDSGSIEQDADVVMMVFREEYYLERSEPSRRPDESDEKFNARYEVWESNSNKCRGLAEIIVAKQRRGATGIVKARFDSALTKFSDLDEQDEWSNR